MYNLDERLQGLPAVKEQVVGLHQSLNQPHLAIPNRKASPATAFVLGLRGPNGFAVFVYLYLHETSECAVYTPSSGTVPAERYESEESDALSFVESMGFIMDNLNFRGRPADEQDAFLKSLPVFQREPPKGVVSSGSAVLAAAGKPKSGSAQSLTSLGKLFSAFCLALGLSACAHVSEKDARLAQIHAELAVANLVQSPRVALKEAEESIAVDPENAEAWHVKGILMHTVFGRLDEARAAYDKALALKTPFPEAHVNLGNLFIDLKRYDEAIAQYDVALADVMYGAPFIAHGNMGWAYYKKGVLHDALDHLKASVTINPKYCRGHLQLGQIYDGEGKAEEACKAYLKYREHCPDQADAWQHEGICQARAGQRELAQKAFATCVERAKADEVKEQCEKLRAQLQ